jgi:hypothetical protein
MESSHGRWVAEASQWKLRRSCYLKKYRDVNRALTQERGRECSLRKGAAVGAAAGSLLATPAGQMALARLLKSGMPEILARGLVASGFGQGGRPRP